MSDDRAFLDSLRVNPDDDARWLVYADWLDDHGDPRGEYIRLVLALATSPDPARRRRLNAVRPTLPREWLAEVEQPTLIRANPTPYPFSWPAVDLGDIRPTQAAYSGNDYRTLPPVPVEWIVRFEEWYDRTAADAPPGGQQPDDENQNEDMTGRRAIADDFAELWERVEQDCRTGIPRLSVAANDFGLRLPDRFARFFTNDRRRELFRSVTEFNLPDHVVPAPECPEAGLIRFCSDGRGHRHWYLYLTPEGDECVVTSVSRLGGSWALRQLAELSSQRYEDEDEPGRDFTFCAPSFAGFIVRSWLESMAWYSLHLQYAGPIEARGARAPEVGAYLKHYQRSDVRRPRSEARGA